MDRETLYFVGLVHSLGILSERTYNDHVGSIPPNLGYALYDGIILVAEPTQIGEPTVPERVFVRSPLVPREWRDVEPDESLKVAVRKDMGRFSKVLGRRIEHPTDVLNTEELQHSISFIYERLMQKMENLKMYPPQERIFKDALDEIGLFIEDFIAFFNRDRVKRLGVDLNALIRSVKDRYHELEQIAVRRVI